MAPTITYHLRPTHRPYSSAPKPMLPHQSASSKRKDATNGHYSNTPILIDDQTVNFSRVLLRDSCSCSACVHESTNQRLFSVADIPADIKSRTVNYDAASDAFSITWENDAPGYPADHTTKLSLTTLRNISSSGCHTGSLKEPVRSQVLWTQEPLNLPDYDYQEYMKDDHILHQVICQLRTHGVAFVTGIPGVEESLATIATRIGPFKDTFYGYAWDVRTVPAAINAAYTSHDLGFHTDLLYFQQPPHIQLLHCIQSASSGGASVFADAYKAAVDLFHTDIEAFDILATVPVNYHYNHPDSLPSLHRDGGFEWTEASLVDCMDKINWGPPFLAPFSLHDSSTHPEPSTEFLISVMNSKVDKWHQAAVKFNALLQRPEYLFERKMKPGEGVLFDNTRTLHSRRSFDMADVGKPRWLRGTYVDKDAYFSKLRVLQNKIGTLN
ncbi:unnamed protein product [Clonostachys chloroleuca]|uniref:Clavaminate synthase-like protein n=1 Tax=Clonostachys chloroleuca TaxID=1926264 RepID=A0AA35LYT9_9HYPO|nr:unnamed protein product [Clonostachys chloroleuca]